MTGSGYGRRLPTRAWPEIAKTSRITFRPHPVVQLVMLAPTAADWASVSHGGASLVHLARALRRVYSLALPADVAASGLAQGEDFPRLRMERWAERTRAMALWVERGTPFRAPADWPAHITSPATPYAVANFVGNAVSGARWCPLDEVFTGPQRQAAAALVGYCHGMDIDTIADVMQLYASQVPRVLRTGMKALRESPAFVFWEANPDVDAMPLTLWRGEGDPDIGLEKMWRRREGCKRPWRWSHKAFNTYMSLTELRAFIESGQAPVRATRPLGDMLYVSLPKEA